MTIMVIMKKQTLALLLLVSLARSILASDFHDGFEQGLDNWEPFSPGYALIVSEAEGNNHVLELTPRSGDYSHVILKADSPTGHARMEGRFLFPTEGDGYLGLIYNHIHSDARTDFGVLYVKSNGSYIRVSPHYDGNPSWRLHEEKKVMLEGDRRIEPGRWYRFRLDVHEYSAALYIEDMETPAVVFNEAPNSNGAFGLEARPGRGEPVWVDDIRIMSLEPITSPETNKEPESKLGPWQYQPAIEDSPGLNLESPVLDESGWQSLETDSRGAIITGQLTQNVSGDRSVVYLRTSFEGSDEQSMAWFAISSANRIDVWKDGYFRGTVAPEQYIWSDHISVPEHVGARLPLRISPGRQEILLRVHGDRFAGGGFFADILFPR